MANIKPLGSHIVVKPLEAEKKTASGIIIPDTAGQDRPEQGEVVAVGPGKVLENGSRAPMEVTVGQRVVFKKYGPQELKIDNQELLVVEAEDVIAIVE